MGDNPNWKRRSRITVAKAVSHNHNLAEYAKLCESLVQQVQADADKLRVDMMNAAILARTHITFTPTPGAFRARRQLDAMISGLRNYRRPTDESGAEGAEQEAARGGPQGGGQVPNRNGGIGHASDPLADRQPA